jgi:hypothetical protein
LTIFPLQHAGRRYADALAAKYEASKAHHRPGYIPGYSGFVPLAKDIAGRSQTRISARALSHTADEISRSDPLPAEPNHKQSLLRTQEWYAAQRGRTIDLPARHISGYTGAFNFAVMD